MIKKLFWFLMLFLKTIPTFSQIPKDSLFISGKFLSDSVEIGLPIKYSLVARHSTNMEILFPDTLYDYKSFKYLEKKYFPTHTKKNISTDSVIYSLVSFETTPLQTLLLPIFIIQGKDCTKVFSKMDTVYFKSLINGNEEIAGLKENVNYYQVGIQEDFTKYYVLGGIGLLFISLIWALFGKRIRRTYKLYLLSIQHRSFSVSFERLRRRLRQENTVQIVEGALVLWKNYMEDIEDEPFSTYTSKEILKFIPDENLSEALKYIDKVIYGQLISQQAPESLDTLEKISLSSYRNKRENVKKEFRI